jgi:hypothetical protein
MIGAPRTLARTRARTLDVKDSSHRDRPEYRVRRASSFTSVAPLHIAVGRAL